MEQAYDYGMWLVVAINAALFIGFVSSYLAPVKRREWRSFGALTAFIIALFTEMYGFPLTIYLLGLYLGRLPFADPFAHASGNLWASLFLGPGWSGAFMALGFLPILLGGSLVAAGWKRIHQANGELVTDGIYATIRHPQYAGLFLAIVGSLIWWPSLITFLMAPILLWSYYLLRRDGTRARRVTGHGYRWAYGMWPIRERCFHVSAKMSGIGMAFGCLAAHGVLYGLPKVHIMLIRPVGGLATKSADEPF